MTFRSVTLKRQIALHMKARLTELLRKAGDELIESRRKSQTMAQELAESTDRAVAYTSELVDAILAEPDAVKPLRIARIKQQIEIRKVLINATLLRLEWQEEETRALEEEIDRTEKLSADALEPDEAVEALRQELSAVLKEERRDVLRKIAEDEWADLPTYSGEDTSRREHCLHCGEELDEQDTFCSAFCRSVHQSIYGPLRRA